MKPYYIILLSLCVAALFYSCNYENITIREITNPLEVTTVEQSETRAIMEETFDVDSRIGLYVTKGDIEDPYEENYYYSNVKAVYNGATWDVSPEVLLSMNPAIVWAYYPFKENMQGNTIAIDLYSQIDYMYGGHSTEKIINYENNVVTLTMKHALSLLEFQFSGNGVEGKSVVTSIKIEGREDLKNIATAATLNCQTGAITTTRYGTIEMEKEDGIFKNTAYRHLIVIPTKTTGQGDITFTFTIDGDLYTYLLPAGTVWEQGRKYVYNITFDGKEMVVGEIKIEEWKPGDVTDLEIV